MEELAALSTSTTTTITASPHHLGLWNDSTQADTHGTSTARQQPGPHPLIEVSDSMWYVGLPIILLLGTFGNVMTVIIMGRMTTGESTINLYFTATAVVDLVSLYSISLVHWLKYVLGFRVNAVHTLVCKLQTWVYTCAGTVGCWFVVCLTLHRALSVVWPHRVHVLCTRRTVYLVLAAVVVVLAALYSHYAVGFEQLYSPHEKMYACTVRPTNVDYIRFFLNAFVYIELVIYSLIPFMFLVVSNGVLVWKLTQSVRAAGRHLTAGDSEQVLAREKAANSVTLTVIVVSVTFLILTMPISVSFILNYFKLNVRGSTRDDQAKATLTNAITGLLGHSNHAVNFYLYCLTGRRFREEFWQVVCCFKLRGRHGVSSAATGVGAK